MIGIGRTEVGIEIPVTIVAWTVVPSGRVQTTNDHTLGACQDTTETIGTMILIGRTEVGIGIPSATVTVTVIGTGTPFDRVQTTNDRTLGVCQDTIERIETMILIGRTEVGIGIPFATVTVTVIGATVDRPLLHAHRRHRPCQLAPVIQRQRQRLPLLLQRLQRR